MTSVTQVRSPERDADATLRVLHQVGSDLLAELARTEVPDITTALRQCSEVLNASLVTYRSITDGVATFVAGWSPNTHRVHGADRRLLDPDALPLEPFCEHAPVYLLPEPAEELCGILDTNQGVCCPRLLIPSVVDNRITGYLHLTLSLLDEVSSDELGALRIIGQLCHQLQVHAERERDRSERSQIDDLLRRISVTFLALAPGEESDAIDEATAQLGAALAANHITYWDIDLFRKTAVRSNRWAAPGSSVPLILSDDASSPHSALRFFEGLTETVELTTANAPGWGDIIIDTTKHEVLLPIAVPSRLGTALRGAVIASRTVDRPWLTWETDAIALFAEMVPQIRARLATEAQVMASFYDAPVGITLRDDRGQLLDCNQAFLDFLGVEHERELLGQGGIELLASDELTEAMFDTLLNPSPEGTRGLELPYRHANGSVVWGRISSSPLPSGTGVSWLTHIEDITATRAERERDRERATRDSLTGLPNRHQIADTLTGLLDGSDASTPFTVMMLDLDGFKEVNDGRGHLVGDELLSTIGRRLRNRVRAGDLVGRFGGDEFVAILSGHHSADAIAIQAQRLRECICAPVNTESGDVSVGVSIGAAASRPDDTVDSLLARADAAMYSEKAAAKNDFGPRAERRVLGSAPAGQPCPPAHSSLRSR